MRGGKVVEGITSYNRLHGKISRLESGGDFENDNIEGFGVSDSDRIDDGVAANHPDIGDSRRVSFKQLSGLLTQQKLIPLKQGNLQFEFELVSDPDDPVYKDGDFSVIIVPGCSNDWTITDVQVKASVVTLDNVIQNQITKHLLDGGSLDINYHTFINSKHVLTTSNGLIQVNRSLSRLADVFITFDQSDRGDPTVGYREFNNFKTSY